jgi:hypothetical protein
MRLVRTILLVVSLAVASTSSAAARYAEFLPAWSTIDEDLALLRADGVLPDMSATVRPLARTDVAAALIDAWRAHPALAADPVYQRLVWEFSREIAELRTAPGDAPATRAETRPLVVLERDPSATLRGSAYAAMLARTAPDSTSELHPGTRVGGRVTLRVAPSIVVHEEWTAGRVQDARRFSDYILGVRDFAAELPRAYASFAVGSARVQVGRDAARWGPGLAGPLMLSDAAGSATVLSGSATVWRTLTAAARTHVLSAERGRYLSAHTIEWRASPRWTLALSEAALYASRGPEIAYIAGFIPYTIVQRHATEDAGDSLADPLRNNLLASVDVIYRPAPGWEMRAQILVDDVQLSSNATPNRSGMQVGLTRTTRVAGTQRVSARAEYTRVSAHTYSVYYAVAGDRDYVFHERPLAFPLGPDAEAATLRIEWDRSRAVRGEARVEQTRTGAGGLVQPWRPGDPVGGTWAFRAPVERRRAVLGLLRLHPTDAVHVEAAIGGAWIANDAHVAGRTRNWAVAWIAAEFRR